MTASKKSLEVVVKEKKSEEFEKSPDGEVPVDSQENDGQLEKRIEQI